jgi:hypothetical protein
MVKLFWVWKKTLWNNCLKKKEVPVFKGHQAKQANHRKAFKEYKESEDAKNLSEKNKKNTEKKKYHHKLGRGGYETAMPKWDKEEQEMLDEGIQLEWIHDWELRARNWFLAHGGSYNEQTWDLLCSDGLRIPRESWKKIAKEIKEGKRKLCPDREKDLLTLVLGSDEHEALALLTRGGLGLPKTKILTEVEREQRSDNRRRKMTSSTSFLPELTSSSSRLMNLEE